jgi:SNF2 family DNA or RNA helicase
VDAAAVSKPATLRSYQSQAVDWMLDRPRCAVWAGMGMGKTLATATALSHLALVDSQPMLIVAPLRVACSVWPEEFRKWDHLRGIEVSPILGTEAQRIGALRRDVQVFTTNYESLPWLVEHLAGRWPFRTVVADESTRLKGFRASVQVTQAGVEFVRKSSGGGKRAMVLGRIAHARIDRFIELTGTPAPNGLIDLWGQLWFIDQGSRLCRTFTAFKDRWFDTGYDGRSLTPKSFAMEQIKEKLRDVCLTIDAKDHFDLKTPIVTDVFVDLPLEARKIYDDMEKRMFAEIESHGIEAFNAAARTGKCLQIANGAVYIDDKASEWKVVHDEKIAALGEIVEEAGGMPVLVAYQFRSDLHRLRAAFPLARELDKKPQTLADWNAGKIPMLLAHPASAGHGLNLQDGGNILVYFSVDWNLENHQQILERIGPMRQLQSGHNRNVFVYRIRARSTVEDLVIERLETKRDVQAILLDAMKRWESR